MLRSGSDEGEDPPVRGGDPEQELSDGQQDTSGLEDAIAAALTSFAPSAGDAAPSSVSSGNQGSDAGNLSDGGSRGSDASTSSGAPPLEPTPWPSVPGPSYLSRDPNHVKTTRNQARGSYRRSHGATTTIVAGGEGSDTGPGSDTDSDTGSSGSSGSGDGSGGSSGSRGTDASNSSGPPPLEPTPWPSVPGPSYLSRAPNHVRATRSHARGSYRRSHGATTTIVAGGEDSDTDSSGTTSDSSGSSGSRGSGRSSHAATVPPKALGRVHVSTSRGEPGLPPAPAATSAHTNAAPAVPQRRKAWGMGRSGDGSSGPGSQETEEMQRRRLARLIMEAQVTLSDLSLRVAEVRNQNSALGKEKSMLALYLRNLREKPA